MKKITISSYAKLNLTLDIIKKLPSNYHKLMSIMQLISLKDTIIMQESKEIKIAINSLIPLEIPLDQNICFKTLSLLKSQYNIKDGATIMIKKEIPLGSGMAGGSSNAASVIEGLDKLWGLNLPMEEKIGIASKIGKDVPFFLTKGTAMATGTGEKLEELPKPDINFLIANPGFEISTKEAYSSLDYSKVGKGLNSLKMVDLIKENDILGIANNLGNDFTYSIFKRYPTIEQIRDKMIEFGALNSSMSGSGPTVFGIFQDEDKLDKAYDKIKGNVQFLFKAKSVNKGD